MSRAFLFGSLLLCCLSCRAERTLVTVGIEELAYYPHYDFTQGQKRGFIFDFLSLFEQHSSYQFVYVPMPIKRLKYQFFDKQEIDVLYPFNPKWSEPIGAQAELIFSPPIVGILGGTMVLSQNLGKGLEAFRHLAVPRGFTPIEWYKLRDKKQIRIVEVADSLDALKMVIKQRVDGADIEYNVAKHLMRRHKLKAALSLDPQLPFSAVSFHLVTIKQSKLMAELNAFMEQHQSAIKKLKRQFKLKESLVDI